MTTAKIGATCARMSAITERTVAIAARTGWIAAMGLKVAGRASTRTMVCVTTVPARVVMALAKVESVAEVLVLKAWSGAAVQSVTVGPAASL